MPDSTAIHRLKNGDIGDPGLQSVQDAGLVTDLDVTAQPTILPTQTPARTPQPASSPALSQTLEGVTLTLDWVYLEEGRLAMGALQLPYSLLYSKYNFLYKLWTKNGL